jgi:cyclophilin family peptidyl-prolyl cis-trans isomerase
MKKITTLALLIVAIALIFSGCQAPDTTSSTDNSVKLLDRNLATDSQSLNDDQNNPDTLSSTSYQLTQQSLSNTNPPEKTMKQLSDFKNISATQATINTSKGKITIELFREQAPITTANFVNLASDSFYDGIRFHRIIEDFMAQVGDPLSKDLSMKSLWGTGDPGYTIPDEFDSNLKHDSAGVVSMANAGPNTGGSQFFITFGPTPWLDGKHAIFGKVTSGMEVLDSLEIEDEINSIELK